MRIARIDLAVSKEPLGDVVIATVYDAEGREIHKKAAEYKEDPNQGVALLLEYMSNVMRESYRDEDGAPSFTWHKQSS